MSSYGYADLILVNLCLQLCKDLLELLLLHFTRYGDSEHYQIANMYLWCSLTFFWTSWHSFFFFGDLHLLSGLFATFDPLVQNLLSTLRPLVLWWVFDAMPIFAVSVVKSDKPN